VAGEAVVKRDLDFSKFSEIYRAHRAIIFAIARLSCIPVHITGSDDVILPAGVSQ